MALTKEQKRLAKRLGEAAAARLIRNRQPVREFVVEDVRDAIAARQAHPTVGLFRYLPGTPHDDQAPLVTHSLAAAQSFILPNPVEFAVEYMPEIKPPKVPSNEWDAAYDSAVNVGRIDWPGRTAAMNFTASLYSCPKLNGTVGCNTDLFWIAVAIEVLPPGASVYDVVTTFAKLSVALHDTQIMITTLKDGFWFWRPAIAYRAGDERHAPIPNWTLYSYPFFDPEYPSGIAMLYAAAATVVQGFFGKEQVPFTIDRNGVFGPTCPGSTAGMVIGPRHFNSLWAVVEEAKLGRLYAGTHYNISVHDGAIAGEVVGSYVLKHWAKTTPSGVLPATEYLNFVAKLPNKAGEYSPSQKPDPLSEFFKFEKLHFSPTQVLPVFEVYYYCAYHLLLCI